MRDIISSILKGNYIQSIGSLDLSVTKVEIEVSCDCDYEGSFRVSTNEGGVMQGTVLSSDLRMEVLTSDIAGTEEEVFFHFHGDLCKPGDEIKGFFTIVSDHGEYIIPFNVRIEPGELSSSMGPIRNLFNFVNLAKSNWNEALELFYKPKFRRIFCGADEYFNGLYSALSANPGNEQNLEEFLLCTGKKSRVQYFYEKKALDTALMGVEFSEKLVEREIEILRSGWGYTDINISIDGDFILTRRDTLKEKDFIGNVCTLKLFIDTEKCSKGRREGKIVLRNNFTSLEIPIIVRGRLDIYSRNRVRTKTILLEQLTRDYIKRGFGLIEEKEWFEKTGAIVEQLSALGSDDPYVKLFKARLLCIDGRPNEASWLVDQAGDIIEHEKAAGRLTGKNLLEAYAYHWLIASLVKQDREFTLLAANKVETLYKRLPESWQIGAISLMLPTSNNTNSSTRWNMLQRVFESGSRSGILYFEGMKVLNENPMAVKKVDSFLIQTMYFGAKNGAVNQRCLEQFLLISQRCRNYSSVHIHLLKLLYEQFNDKRILQELCSGLIAENRLDKTAHSFYRLAIEKEIKLTNLFEYFIRSMDLSADEDIPVVVLMYFGYSNTLASEQLAYFYYYLIKHKEEFEDLYVGNLQNMEFFANSQIAQGNINKHLAVIYSEILDPESLTRQQAIGISDMIFSKWVSCEKKECYRVFVYQKGCAEPFKYELTDGEGAISVYGTGNVVVFEDYDGNRYVESAKYTAEDLMSVGRYQGAVRELVWDNERLNLYILGTGNSSITVTSENISRFRQLSESKLVRKAVRMRMLVQAMNYYSLQDDDQSFERGYNHLEMDELTAEQMGILFPLLIKYGHTDLAEDWLRNFGPYFISRANLKRYLEKKILKQDEEEIDVLLKRALIAGAVYIFREGNAGSVITQYVAENYEGSCKEMVEIWKSLNNYGIVSNKLDRKLMIQHTYTDSFMPEINTIARQCVDHEPESDLARAVISQAAYAYLIGRENVDGNIVEDIRHLYDKNIDITTAGKLAFLKYYSEHIEEIDGQIGDIVLTFLKEEIEDRIYLGFFKKFLSTSAFKTDDQARRCERILDEIADRTIVDYKVSKGKIAKIHYLIANDGADSYDYAAENMREACGGVVFKDFILFFGETLQYYITEEAEEEASLQGNGQISMNTTGTNVSTSKYALINDMIVSNTTKDYTRFDNLYEEYEEREYLNGELFRLL